MAEARSAVTEPRVDELEEGRDAKQDFLRAWRKAFLRRFFRTRNLIRNGMWPTSLWNLGVTMSLFSILQIGDWHWAKPINSRLTYIGNLLCLSENVPFVLRVVLVSILGGIIFFLILMYKRRWLLRVLLSYRGWMCPTVTNSGPNNEPVRTMSWRTKLWAVVVRLISGYQPTTYSCQKSLPFLPVPNINETLTKFITSIEPLYGKDSEEVAQFKKEAEEFEKGIGGKLQRILTLKSWWAQNWVTDWWEKYIYLMSRTPTAINSNYYILDHCYWKPTHRQTSRAANTIHQYVCVKRQIDREQLPPLVIRNTVPLCMQQYERCFSTTRVPGEEYDSLVQYDTSVSKHVVVMRKGLYYKLNVYDEEGNPLSPKNLEKQLDWIMKDADLHLDEYPESVRALSSLTGMERTEWARARQNYLSNGVNKDSLHVLESAMFHVVLDTNAFKTWAERGKHLLHGDGKTIWFDKTFNIVVFSDGKQGINAEHSWGDAPVIGHVSEFNLTNEVLGRVGLKVNGKVVRDYYDEYGCCLPLENERPDVVMQSPERLVWDVPRELEAIITKAISFNVMRNEDLDLAVSDHNVYGKGFIKTCKVSPDAFVQLALQLAYYKDAGKFALTYEASMTRLYLLGRTETVRSLTNETADFVRAMHDPEKTNEERVALLRKSCSVHQQLYRDAMNGKGIDRHMFGLYVACKGLGYESEFLKRALMMPWTLSTSQQPQQQIASSPDCNLPAYKDKVCPGGGFGPVSDMGYGVSYMLPGDARIFFHVSSKKASKCTDSTRFMKNIFESFAEMAALFDKKGEKGNKAGKDA